MSNWKEKEAGMFPLVEYPAGAPGHARAQRTFKQLIADGLGLYEVLECDSFGPSRILRGSLRDSIWRAVGGPRGAGRIFEMEEEL